MSTAATTTESHIFSSFTTGYHGYFIGIGETHELRIDANSHTNGGQNTHHIFAARVV